MPVAEGLDIQLNLKFMAKFADPEKEALAATLVSQVDVGKPVELHSLETQYYIEAKLCIEYDGKFAVQYKTINDSGWELMAKSDWSPIQTFKTKSSARRSLLVMLVKAIRNERRKAYWKSMDET